MKRKAALTALAIAAGTLTALGTGHVSQPLAAIIAVFLWLRFFGQTRWPVALAVFTALHTLAWELAYIGTVPMPALARISLFAAFSLVFGLATTAHVWAVTRWPRLLAALALPCGWTIIEFASARLSPSGSWGSMAYAFLTWLPAAQIASIVGWVGLTFCAVWLAALGDLAVRRGATTRGGVHAAAVGAALILAVVGFGWIRLASAPAADREIRVLLTHGPTVGEVEGGDILRAYYLGWDLQDAQRAEQPALAASYRERLFQQTAEAMGDAELVVWSETLAWMSYDEEAAWLAHGRTFARERRVLLAMAMSVFDPTRDRLYLNKSVLIDENGEVLWEFLKARPVPGAWHVVGDGVLPAVDTRLGRLGGAICFDMDFPALLGQAGRSGTELFLAPSFDDKRVRWMHARMAVMRAIEQGFTLIRPTAFGVSLVADPYGRRLAEKDAFDGGGFAMSETAPRYETATIYARIGDLFAWACVAGFALILLAARRFGRIETPPSARES